ncbi:MAG: methyltransferase domain-containing protein [Erysipelotrichaceae bacterium]|nr:methyltransferase domain-containing protein [Erysipelotrichaceae bacterium]
MKLLCPKCREQLTLNNRIYRCPNNHCYDQAKEGYVNLVLANQKHSANPGDSSDSLVSRAAFLSRGYYRKLAEGLCSVLGEYLKDGDVLLDAGCGTGYYLNYIISHLPLKLEYFGCDVAKKGVAMSAKNCPEATLFVGNVFHLPVADASLDALMSVFCPYSGQEFGRVVKDGGYVIAVTPGKEHLYQIKELVYENPYYNAEAGYDLPGFELVKQFNIRYEADFENNEDITTLWNMTPYVHTTSYSDNQKVFALSCITSTVDFLVSVYRKGER